MSSSSVVEVVKKKFCGTEYVYPMDDEQREAYKKLTGNVSGKGNISKEQYARLKKLGVTFKIYETRNLKKLVKVD